MEAGFYDDSSHVFSSSLSDDDVYSNYRFVVKFDLETILRVTADGTVSEIETAWESESGIVAEYTHYLPRFTSLQFAGGALFYEPAYEYWRQRNITHVASNSGPINVNAFGGEDQNDDVQFETEPVETENGFFTKLWHSMSLENWLFVICGVFAFICIACSTCAWVFYKIKQNTHENNDAFTAMD